MLPSSRVSGSFIRYWREYVVNVETWGGLQDTVSVDEV